MLRRVQVDLVKVKEQDKVELFVWFYLQMTDFPEPVKVPAVERSLLARFCKRLTGLSIDIFESEIVNEFRHRQVTSYSLPPAITLSHSLELVSHNI